MQFRKQRMRCLTLLLMLFVTKLQGQAMSTDSQAPQTDNRFFLLDLIFLLDGSNSVSKPNFERVKDFVQQIAEQFNISDGSTQIGVIQYSSYQSNRSLEDQMYIETEIALGATTDPDVFKNSLDAIELHGQGTYTSSALNKTVLDFESSPRYLDPSTVQVIVLFTDGRTSDGRHLSTTAEYVRSLGIKIFAVGVGLNSKDELKIIATGTDSDEGVYSVNGFSDLNNIVMDVRSAIDINECDNDTVRATCPPNSACFNTVGSYACQCNEGYSGNQTACFDVDECEEETDNCHPNATCNNTIGSHTCDCKVGFNGTGFICTDNNECQTSSDNCDDNAVCTNEVGSFSCTCGSGFSGDGITCADIDECQESNLSNCSTNALCTNNEGSFTCLCQDGFSGNGTLCEDVDECATSNQNDCHNDAICTNIPGTFECRCNTGFSGDGRNCTVTISVSCLDSFMSVSIVSTYLTERSIAPTDLRFLNTSCTGTVDQNSPDFWVYETGLSECSTEVTNTGTSLIYSNTLSNIHESGAYIGIPHRIVAECEYSTNVNLVQDEESSNYSVSNAIVNIQPPASSGEFNAEFEIFTDATYTVKDNRTGYIPSDILFVQITLDSSTDDLALRINSCWATPDPSGTPRYTFIDNGCPVAGANENIKVTSNGEGKAARFETPIFGFVNFDSVYLSCSLEACLTTNENECPIDCNSRRKRSLLERKKRQILLYKHIINTKVIFAGPFTILKDQLKTSDVGSIEVETGSGLSSYGLIGISIVCAFIALVSIGFATFLFIRKRQAVGQSREYISFEHIGSTQI